MEEEEAQQVDDDGDRPEERRVEGAPDTVTVNLEVEGIIRLCLDDENRDEGREGNGLGTGDEDEVEEDDDDVTTGDGQEVVLTDEENVEEGRIMYL